MSGLDPIMIGQVLEEMRDQGEIDYKKDLWQLPDGVSGKVKISDAVNNASYLTSYMGHFSFLKSPHPLDYEWRNSTNSLNSLIDVLLNFTKPTDKILILGMPTLFAQLYKRDIQLNVTLLTLRKKKFRFKFYFYNLLISYLQF